MNYTASSPDIQLNGCINDVIQMKNVLMAQYGYLENNITVLRDDDPTDASALPTARNIVAQLQSHVSQSGNLSQLWIHYSGHGSQIPDRNGDEAFGTRMDSVIVPMDFETTGFIVDDFLYSILKNCRCPTVSIWDSCNSGTVCDFPYSYTMNTASGRFVVSRNNNHRLPWSTNPMNLVSLSGCKDMQTSADVSSSSSAAAAGGAFTGAFLKALAQNQYSGSLLKIYADTCFAMTADGFAGQNPVMSSASPVPRFILTPAPGTTAAGAKRGMIDIMSASTFAKKTSAAPQHQGTDGPVAMKGQEVAGGAGVNSMNWTSGLGTVIGKL
jgi:hypothetical protein